MGWALWKGGVGPPVCIGWRPIDPVGRVTDGSWRVTDGGWRSADGSWRIPGRGRPSPPTQCTRCVGGGGVTQCRRCVGGGGGYGTVWYGGARTDSGEVRQGRNRFRCKEPPICHLPAHMPTRPLCCDLPSQALRSPRPIVLLRAQCRYTVHRRRLPQVTGGPVTSQNRTRLWTATPRAAGTRDAMRGGST